ncbi:MAG: hypothetical protein U1E10_18390 [Bdellovibrionales bacterium]|nr:hypothetical protein [Bdellovibrionales bacterium]
MEYDGSQVLEKLAEIDALEAFYDAVDSDDFSAAVSLLKKAKIDKETIDLVIRAMREADGDQ